jgi:hypothetical protein
VLYYGIRVSILYNNVFHTKRLHCMWINIPKLIKTRPSSPVSIPTLPKPVSPIPPAKHSLPCHPLPHWHLCSHTCLVTLKHRAASKQPGAIHMPITQPK